MKVMFRVFYGWNFIRLVSTASTISFVYSEELEMTSLGELDRLIVQLNRCIDSGQPEVCFSMSTRVAPKRVSVEFSNHFSRTVDFDAQGQVEDKSIRGRIECEAVVQIKLEDGKIIEIVGKSKKCLVSQQAPIMAAHDLLRKFSESSHFSDAFRSECQRLFSIAYLRGKVLAVGDVYPFPEDIFLEFKGGDDKEDLSTPWSEKAFMNKFGATVVPSICAFINSKIILGKRQFSPGRIVFGVVDKGRAVRGIACGDLDPEAFRDKLRQTVRAQLEGKIVSKQSWYAIRVGSAVDVHIDIVAPARNTMVSTGTTLIIVTVTFTFDNDVEFPHPCLIRDRKGKVRCYYRRSKPELRTCFLPEDAEEMDALFPLGIPPNLHISGESDEGDVKAEEE